jgi:hypothetical protein
MREYTGSGTRMVMSNRAGDAQFDGAKIMPFSLALPKAK